MIVVVLTVAVTFLGFGPWPSARTDERFPCEACLCGCASARECWTDCCCHTPVERARWALTNDVMIPSWARETLAAATELRSSIAPGVEIASLPSCCRERLLGVSTPTPHDPATCKRRPTLTGGATVLLCLDRVKSELRFVAPLIGVVAPAIDRSTNLADPEPSVPPPRV